MDFRDLFEHAAAAVMVGALTLWFMHGKQIATPPAPPPDIAIAPPGAGDTPPPREAKPPLPARLAAAGFSAGDGAFVRIFKAEGQLEVWLRRGERFDLFDTFQICAWSGDLGPKQKEGDWQSPEGFYEVGAKQLNPNSAYHLAFNLGFPNAYDQGLGRTGSALMVHGSCGSVGCYAMTDHFVNDIYRLVAAALKNGQRSVPVHIFPFRMTDEAMTTYGANPWSGFWRNLKEGHDLFEASGMPPKAFACGERYAFGERDGASCSAIAAW